MIFKNISSRPLKLDKDRWESLTFPMPSPIQICTNILEILMIMTRPLSTTIKQPKYSRGFRLIIPMPG